MSFSSSSSSSSVPGLSVKKFVTQDEIDEKKKKRQEEWEKVRKPDDPVGKTLSFPFTKQFYV